MTWLRPATPTTDGTARSRRRSAQFILVLLCLLAAAWRIYWALQPRVVWGDETFYLWVGQSILGGQGQQFFGYSGSHFSPLFPLLAASIARLAQGLGADVTQGLMAGSAVVHVVSGTLLLLPVYGITRRIAGVGPALVAALVAAVYPMLTAGALLWSTGTEALYLLLLAVAWWGLLVALQEDRPGGYALAGAMLALAYLARTEALVYLAVGAGAVVLFGLAPGRARRLRRAAGGAGLLLATFFLLISPYLIVLWAQTGHFQLTEDAGLAYTSMQGLAERDIAMFDAATWKLEPGSGEVYLFAPASEQEGLLSAILADPAGFLRRLRVNTVRLLDTTFSASLLPWPLAALAILGLFSRPWSRRRAAGELLLSLSLAGPLSIVLFDIQARYLVGLLLPALVWIGEGVAWVGVWLARTIAACAAPLRPQPFLRSAMLAVRALPALLLTAILLWQTPSVWEMMHWTHSFQPGHLAAAAELRALGVPADSVVMSRYPAIAFHAGTRWAATPAATWPEVAAYARRKGARYLVIDAWEAQLRPQLQSLLDPTQAPVDLLYITTVDGGAGPVLLYQFR